MQVATSGTSVKGQIFPHKVVHVDIIADLYYALLLKHKGESWGTTPPYPGRHRLRYEASFMEAHCRYNSIRRDTIGPVFLRMKTLFALPLILGYLDEYGPAVVTPNQMPAVFPVPAGPNCMSKQEYQRHLLQADKLMEYLQYKPRCLQEHMV